MKSFILLCVIFACSVSLVLPKESLPGMFSPFKRILSKKPAITRSYNPFTEEDIKYCGTYEGECESEEYFSTKYNLKFLGMMHKNPIYLSMPVTLFMGANCQEEQKMYTSTMEASVKVTNSVTKSVDLTFAKSLVQFYSDLMISSLTCSEPIELDKTYDIMDLDCKDATGEDIFKDVKEMIGTTVTTPITFSEGSIALEFGTFSRVSDVGCTCASSVMKEASSMLAKLSSVKRAREEDIKYCGAYSTGCISSPLVSMQSDATLLGMMHKNPIYMQFPVAMYLGDKCVTETEMMVMTVSGGLKVANDVKKSVDWTFEKGTVKFINEMMIAQYTCSEPLELNKEYDIATLDCKDEEGNDPFADMKSQIGQTATIEMTFGEKSLSIVMDESDPMVLERLSDTGCHCAKNLRAYLSLLK